MTAWFSAIHKKTAIKYSEYDPDTERVSLKDKIDSKEIGSKYQEVITKGLLDLSIFDKAPDIHREVMAGGRYYDSKTRRHV